jgi:hypothetical protein
MEHPACSSDLALAVSKNKVCLKKKDKDFRLLKISKKFDDSTEIYSTTGIPKMYPIMICVLCHITVSR